MDLRSPLQIGYLTRRLGKAQGYSLSELEQAMVGQSRGGPEGDDLPLGMDYNFVGNDYQGPGHLRSVAKVLHP